MSSDRFSSKLVGEVSNGEQLMSRLTLEHFDMPAHKMVALEQEFSGLLQSVFDLGIANLPPDEKAKLDSLLDKGV